MSEGEKIISFLEKKPETKEENFIIETARRYEKEMKNDPERIEKIREEITEDEFKEHKTFFEEDAKDEEDPDAKEFGDLLKGLSEERLQEFYIQSLVVRKLMLEEAKKPLDPERALRGIFREDE